MQQRRNGWKRKKKQQHIVGERVATIVLQLQVGKWETPVEFVGYTMAHIPYLSISHSFTSDR